MIEEGNSREQAEQETGLLLSILELVHKSSLDLQVRDDRIHLAWDLVFDE